MGYFSNATEAEIYLERFCYRCANWRHDPETDTLGCPIFDLQFLYNYDLQDKSMQRALSHFIPTKGASNEECRMFLEMQQ